MKLPTLYSRDDKGRARMWEVRTEGDKIIVTHGLVDGKQRDQVTVAKPKNVGRSNETTPEQQAESEARSKWIHQIERKDYAEDIEEANKQLRAMLAKDYHKEGHQVRWHNVAGQPKLDGCRLTYGYRFKEQEEGDLEMLTRKGEVYTVTHLEEDGDLLFAIVNGVLENEFPGKRCTGIDGEVYIHGLPLNKITSLARKYQPGKTEKLDYYVFDLVIPGLSFEQRYHVLQQAMSALYTSDRGKKFVLVPVDELSSYEEMLELHAKYVSEGYEGLILRHYDGHYKYGPSRSSDLFKYKLWEDEECRIIDMWEDKNGLAMLVCKRKDTLDFGAGVVLDVTPKRTHDERKQMLLEREKWIGEWITVRYQLVTPDGSLQFPRGMERRECDEDGEPIV